MTTIKKLEECHLTVLSQSFYAFWSKDNYHENVAGMMAAGSFQPIQCLVKDDVFLAQPLDQDDTASLSSHSSTSTQDHKFISPCLSPVSSPTQFLSNHEPLFDGIEDQLLDPVECDKAPKRSRQEDTVSHQKRRKKAAPRKQKVQPSNNSSDNTSQLIEKQDETDTTLFQHLTESGIHWCRYCGTTEGVNWRPGPWGKRTLCK